MQQQPQAAEIIQQLQDLQVKADTLDTSITAINSEISSSKRGPITEANTFHGHPGEDIDTFLYSFELKATANNWTAEKQLNELPLCLQDTALRIYRQLEAGQKDTFPHLRAALKDAFRTPGAESVARAKLYRFKQLPGQTVLEYATKLQDVFAAAYPNLPAAESDKILLDHFLNNIRETLGDKVKMFEPENFRAALAKAQKLEAQDNEKFSKQVHSIGRGDSHGHAYQRPSRGWRNKATQDRMSPRERVQCFNCQELGHYARECFDQDQEETEGTVNAVTARDEAPCTSSTDLKTENEQLRQQVRSLQQHYNKLIGRIQAGKHAAARTVNSD